MAAMMWMAVSLGRIDVTSAILWLLAWFVTIGLHEGGHAWVAWWLGDDTAYLLGKRSLNPVRHIDFKDNRSLIATVVIPVITVFVIGWPLGIASVPVNPSKFHHPSRDMALTSIAGPGGNLIGAILGALLLAVAVFLAVQTNASLQLHPFEFVRGSSAALDLLSHFALRMLILNVILGAINLVPIPGVDGGEVMYHFLNPRGRHIFNQLRPYGILIFVLIVWYALQKPINALFMFAAVDVPGWIFSLFRG
ncbi:MAG: site-2 protease family protein [Planctomycetes bacterium]|nr:site-2 protease family protein [Planctomycetota bacterium]MCB9934722.1 site-2 protease family protein [Planctomycetota bacterium]